MNVTQADTSNWGPEHRGSSQLFLLRVWLDDASRENEWYGRVQHAVTGETHTFQTCAELRQIIRDMMSPPKSDQFTNEP